MIRRILIVIFGLWALVAIVGYLIAWRPVPVYMPSTEIELPRPVMSGEEYGEVIDTHPRPYIVDIQSPKVGAVLVYGAEHTRDPRDPQIADIRAHWEQFHPTVALVESRLGVLFPGLMDPVETFAEAGAAHALARSGGIPTYSWEPPLEVKMENLLAQPFSQEQIALYVMLTPYFSNRRFGRPDDPEAYVAEAVSKRAEWPGIENVFPDVAAVNASWQRHFPDGPDWREVSDEFGLPGFLAGIDGNAARDEHFIRVIIDLVRQGERVFAVAGLSHAVRLDAALQAALVP